MSADYRVLEAEIQLNQVRIHRLTREIEGIRRELDAAITAVLALLDAVPAGGPSAHALLKAKRVLLARDLGGRS